MRPRLPLSERQPNPALKGTRGYALACFPWLRPPAPLSSGVGLYASIDITPDLVSAYEDIYRKTKL